MLDDLLPNYSPEPILEPRASHTIVHHIACCRDLKFLALEGTSCSVVYQSDASQALSSGAQPVMYLTKPSLDATGMMLQPRRRLPARLVVAVLARHACCAAPAIVLSWASACHPAFLLGCPSCALCTQTALAGFLSSSIEAPLIHPTRHAPTIQAMAGKPSSRAGAATRSDAEHISPYPSAQPGLCIS